MSESVELQFCIDISNEESLSVQGPLFSKWAPDGKSDAIVLCDNQSLEVKVWFERKGKVPGTFYFYDGETEPSESATSTLLRQVPVDGGYLYGEVTRNNIDEDQFAVLKNDRRENEAYLEFLKDCSYIIEEYVSPLVNLLRTEYGQYWLSPPRKGDHQGPKLLATNWGLQYRTEEDERWRKIRPELNEPVVIQKNTIDQSEYIREKDWNEIRNSPKTELDAAHCKVLADAKRAHRHGDYRFAYLFAAVALEISTNSKLETLSSEIRKTAGQTLNSKTGVSPKVAIMASLMGVAENKIELALEGLEIRNRIAHEGDDPATKESFPDSRRTVGEGTEHDQKLSAMYHVAHAIAGVAERRPRPEEQKLCAEADD